MHKDVIFNYSCSGGYIPVCSCLINARASDCFCARGWMDLFIRQSRQIPVPRHLCRTKSYWSSSLIGYRSELLCSLLVLPSSSFTVPGHLIWGLFLAFLQERHIWCILRASWSRRGLCLKMKACFSWFVFQKLTDLPLIVHLLSAARLPWYCQGPNGFSDGSQEAW